MAKNEKDAEIRAIRLKLEQNYVTTFLERATEENVENRYRFTRYLSALTLDPDLKEGWAVLFTDAEKERNEKKARLEALRGQTDEEAKEEVARLRRELDATKTIFNFIEVVPTSLSAIQEAAPCPENSEPVISALEMYKDVGLQTSKKFLGLGIGFGFTSLNRTYNIARFCRTEDNEILGDVIVFAATGDESITISADMFRQLFPKNF